MKVPEKQRYSADKPYAAAFREVERRMAINPRRPAAS
jgi:hypothetical protein